LSSLRPPAALRPDRLAGALFVVAALSPRASAAGGEVVAALDERIQVVFQARDGAHWFGSSGQGVYRFDGERIVRFAREHGLLGSRISSIQEDGAGNLYVQSDPGGVSRFDGTAFHALPVAAPSRSRWKLGPDDLWFAAGQDTGAVYRFDGAELHRLALPRTERGEAFVARHPRTKYPNMKYSPYDVYTAFKDSRGHVWFGTASLGVCRYDGSSFAWLDETEFDFGEHHSFGTRSIIEDEDGRFWFGKTLHRFDVRLRPSSAPAEGGNVALEYRREAGVGLESDAFSVFLSAAKDKNGDLLLATLGAGVWRYDGSRMTHHPVPHRGSPIWVHSIYRDRQDVLWVGTQEHGVYRFDGGRFEPFRP
jgi:ligand-binding sensor domain-containing protein